MTQAASQPLARPLTCRLTRCDTCALWTQAPIAYTTYGPEKYPWLTDENWSPPMLAHRGGHYMGGPVDWATGRSA